MKQKAEKCEHCGADLLAKTTRKKFCSSKCRVYANRQAKTSISIVTPATKVAATESVIQVLSPPPTLKGIDLAIWKAEQKSKSSL